MSSQEVSAKRKALGWSVPMLAYASGVHPSTIRRYEKGGSLNKDSLSRIVEALNG